MYYHVRIEYDSEGKVAFAYETNLSDVQVSQIANQYNKGYTVFIGGQNVFVKRIKQIKIFRTDDRVTNRLDYQITHPQGYHGNFGGHDATRLFIAEPPSFLQPLETNRLSELLQYISFLQLDENWIFATIALQLQEVAVTKIAKAFGIALDKENVERILEIQLDERKESRVPFPKQYQAFLREVENLHGVEMSEMPIKFREMRSAVLHEGYNPKPEETDSIIVFTKGFLQKLESINNSAGDSFLYDMTSNDQ